MQTSQLTNDAGYKFELWKKLLSDVGPRSADSGGAVQDSVTAAIYRVALPTVQNHLPRRVREPCCLTGACATPSVPYLHRCVQLGRSRIETPESCRDELCFCLAHAAACAGDAVDLVVHGYYSSGNDMRSRYRGLRCLLHHTRACSIRFESVDNQHDTREIVGELTHLLRHANAHGCWRELHLVQCGMSPLSFRNLLTSLEHFDTLTHVSLENCHVGSCAVVAEYVRGSHALTHLSLRGTILASDWASVGEAVAHAPSVVHLNVSACNWQDRPHLSDFTAALSSFEPRPRFDVDFSSNLLTSKCFAVLAGASARLAACVTGLSLGGHRFMDDEEPLSLLLSTYAQLNSLSLARSTLSTGSAQRVLRALGDKKKQWRLVDVAFTALPPVSFKRIAQATFIVDVSTLVCSGVDLHGQITKAGFAGCAAVLSRLELAHCSLTDECVGQLAAALEKGAPLPLRHLSLSYNVTDKGRTRGDGSFPFLFKALRGHSAPRLESVNLCGNWLPLLPVVAFIEQASPTMRTVDLSRSSIANSTTERVRVLTTLMRRQRGPGAFPLLDILMDSSVEEPWTGLKEVTEWLATQTSVRLVVHTHAGGLKAKHS